MDYIEKSRYRIQIKDSINVGIFDSILFVPINKGDIFHKLPSPYKEATAQSTFYRFLFDRRLYLFKNRNTCLNSFNSLLDEVTSLNNLDSYDLQLVKITIKKFKEYVEFIKGR